MATTQTQAPPPPQPPPMQAPPPPPQYGAPAPAPQKKGIWGLLAGIFLILGAISWIGIGLAGLLGTATYMSTYVGQAMAICFVVPLILGLIGLLGGIFSIKRKKWGIALIGSILTANILALIFLIVGKNEFS